MSTTRTIHALTAVAVVLLAACGGDDDSASDGSVGEPATATEDSATSDDGAGDGAGDDAAADDATPTDDGSADEPATDGGSTAADEPSPEPASEPAPGVGENVAVITIDGQTYEIDVTPGPISRCDPNFFGAFWALGGDSDNAGIELLLPPPDDPNFEDPPTVQVRTDGGDVEWIADPSREMAGVEPGGSQVDDFTVDGNTVSGTATFVDVNDTYAFQGGVGDPPVSVTGTFSVTCSGG